MTVLANHIYRVQDKEGRGPFRPGLSKKWADKDGFNFMPPFFDEFGMGVVDELHDLIFAKGGAGGCAVAERAGISKWFTKAEQCRLAKLGFNVVSMFPDVILRESETQIVFWRAQPLHVGGVIIPWREYLAA